MFPLVVFADCLSLSPAQCLFVEVTHDGAVCFHSLSLQTVSHSRLLNVCLLRSHMTELYVSTRCLCRLSLTIACSMFVC